MNLADLESFVLDVGSDSLAYFGGRWEGGYCLQQAPWEIVRTIAFLQDRREAYNNYLEIGAASGGLARVLCDCLNIGNVFIVDDNQHPKSALRHSNLTAAKHSGETMEWIGHAPSKGFDEWLKSIGALFDLVVIDCSDSFDELVSQIASLEQYLNHDAVIVMHDTVALPDSRGRILTEIAKGMWPQLRVAAHYVNPDWRNRFGIGIFTLDARPIHGWWHIATINNWEQIVLDQFAALSRSSLLNAADCIHMSCLGNYERLKVLSREWGSKFSLDYVHEDVGQYEFPTLHEMQQWCYGNNGDVFYLHTKGASQSSPPAQQAIQHWRRFMEHFTIDRWHSAHRALLKHNCSGVCLRHHPFPHFSGNFWWARSEYIRNLYPVNQLDLRERIEAETWIGRPVNGVAMNAVSLFQPSNEDLYRHLMLPEEYVAERYPGMRFRTSDRGVNSSSA